MQTVHWTVTWLIVQAPQLGVVGWISGGGPYRGVKVLRKTWRLPGRIDMLREFVEFPNSDLPLSPKKIIIYSISLRHEYVWQNPPSGYWETQKTPPSFIPLCQMNSLEEWLICTICHSLVDVHFRRVATGEGREEFKWFWTRPIKKKEKSLANRWQAANNHCSSWRSSLLLFRDLCV